MRPWLNILFIAMMATACTQKAPLPVNRSWYDMDTSGHRLAAVAGDTVETVTGTLSSPPAPSPVHVTDSTRHLADSIVNFAETLIGVPYRYAGADPDSGFDCSGFINYVFRHFNIPVPRSSIDFDDKGMDVDMLVARPGDLVLFTGTNPAERAIGHIGIITANNNGDMQFIHSTSGRQYSVTITPLNDYYRSRFVKVIRVLP